MKFASLSLQWKLALVPAVAALLVVAMVLALSDWLLDAPPGDSAERLDTALPLRDGAGGLRAKLAACLSRQWSIDLRGEVVARAEYAAFRVAREAVNNALAHARPGMVRVAMDGNADRLQVEVDEDGCGLPDGLVDSAPGHLGRVGMRERALAIGARLDIDSAGIGQGTRVTLGWEAA